MASGGALAPLGISSGVGLGTGSLLAGLALAAGFLLKKRKNTLLWFCALAGFFWGWMFGSFQWRALDLIPPAGLEGTFQGKILWLRPGPYGIESLVGDIHQKGSSDIRGKITIRFPGIKDLRPGDSMTWIGRIDPLSGKRNPGGFSMKLHGISRGIVGRGRARLADKIGLPPDWKLIPKRMAYNAAEIYRQRALARLGSASDMASAIMLGDKQQLSPGDRRAFSNAGVSHLLAVSGLHVGISSAILFGVSRSLGLSLWICRLVTLFGVLFHVLMAGASPSALRAGIGVALFLGLRIIGRPVDLRGLLAAVALIILIPNPLALMDVSFQLSFLAAACLIAWAQPWTQSLRQWLPEWIAAPLAVSTVAQISVTPTSLYYFHETHPLGPLVNLIAVPLGTGAFILTQFVVAIPEFLMALFQPLAEAARLMFELLRLVTRYVSSLPLVSYHLPAPHSLWLICVSLVLLALALGVVPRKTRRRGVWLLVASASVLPIWAALPRSPEITFLDVGHGDATFIRFSNQRTMLIDGGSRRQGRHGERTVLPYLWQRGVRRLDAVVMTHDDEDHIGGLNEVLAAMPIGTLIMGKSTLSGKGSSSFIKTWIENNQIQKSSAGDRVLLSAKGSGIKVLWPPKNLEGWPPNESSLVFNFSFLGVPILMMGDAGWPVENVLLNDSKLSLECYLLRVGHHGSLSASSSEFVQKIRPHLAVISCGSRFGLPTTDVLKRFEGAGAEIWMTKQEGGISLRQSSGGVIIEGFASGRTSVLEGI